MFNQTCTLLENKKVAPGHWVMKLRSKVIAKAAKPGQFVQILCADGSCDPLLPRPFSFLNAKGDVFSILYHTVGQGTEFLSKRTKGSVLNVLGPLGNGFDISSESGVRSSETKILVGGGVGIPPLYHLAKTILRNKSITKENLHVFLGARNKSLLLCEKEFKKLGVNLLVATNDGSKGLKGFVTSLLISFLRTPNSQLRTRIYTCGPTAMLKAVSDISVKAKAACEVSVEVPMACGFGACLGCAIKVKKNEKEHRFAIACTEGPVFQASEILWE